LEFLRLLGDLESFRVLSVRWVFDEF